MDTHLLATKLYIPLPRPQVVRRPRLIVQLNAGLQGKLTLISASAGFGKTTLLSEWIAGCAQPTAWLALDAGDNDPPRFLTYVVAALQTIVPQLGAGVLRALQAPQPPPLEALLTALINEVGALPSKLLLVLDDYHVLDAPPIDTALAFLLAHLPPQLHLVLATREDPQLPLARLRARGQLCELRGADLRFTAAEAAEFLNQVMGLQLPAPDIAALETRTEGWIAGLQLAALSMQGHQDPAGFIKTFTGSHRFVLDYLIEEVLHQQPAEVQNFLLQTAILERLCGPLCAAVLRDPALAGQPTLEYLERANLFLVPLDNERRWYRYHHLFRDLLRQRVVAAAGAAGWNVAELHIRASAWYEANNLELEAFHHAVAAADLDRAERLIERDPLPLQFRGGAVPICNWLATLPTPVLDARPQLWVTYASALLMLGQVIGVEQKVQAAETALARREIEPDATTRDLIGRIASIRATLAVTQHEVATIIEQAQRALEYLHPNNLPVRTSITWTLGYAYELQGDRAAAGRAYRKALTVCEAIGHTMIAMMSAIGLGSIQEAGTQLDLAAATYRRAIELGGDPPLPPICDAYLGLARLAYQWNDLAAAQAYAHQSLKLARQIENTDRFVAALLVGARLKLAQRDLAGAVALLADADQLVRRHNFAQQLPDLIATQVVVLLHQGDLTAAAQLAQTHNLPISQAQVCLAQSDPATALALLEPVRRQMEQRGWAAERLNVMLLQALALSAHSAEAEALTLLDAVLVLAEPGGFIRMFVDAGRPMLRLLSAAAAQGRLSQYGARVLSACEAAQPPANNALSAPLAALAEPLSRRELEILALIAQGLSNHEISDRLVLALDTIKGHNRRIYGKLDVQRRTEAVARARELGLL